MAFSCKRSLLAGFLGRFWSMVIGLISVPLLVNLLGSEGYGLVGIFATMQSLIGISDLGIGPTAQREVALWRSDPQGNSDFPSFLKTAETLTWSISCLVGLTIIVCSPWMAQSVVQTAHIPSSEVAASIMLMGMAAFTVLPFNYYYNLLLGIERHGLANTAMISAQSLRAIAGIASLSLIGKNPTVYFASQAIVGIALALSMAYITKKQISPGQDQGSLSWAAIARRRSFFLPIIGNATLGLCLTQIDKVVLATSVPLLEYAKYTLAASLVSLLWSVVIPVNQAFYPRMVDCHAQRDEPALWQLATSMTAILVLLLTPCLGVLVFFGGPVLVLWTGRPEMSDASLPLALMAIGIMASGLCFVPGSGAQAGGWPKLLLMVNGPTAIVLVPVIVWLSLRFGIQGGAIGWAGLAITQFSLLPFLYFRRFHKGRLSTWMIRQVTLPIAVGLIPFALLRFAVDTDGMTRFAVVELLALGSLLSLCLVFLVQPSFGWRTFIAFLRMNHA